MTLLDQQRRYWISRDVTGSAGALLDQQERYWISRTLPHEQDVTA